MKELTQFNFEVGYDDPIYIGEFNRDAQNLPSRLIRDPESHRNTLVAIYGPPGNGKTAVMMWAARKYKRIYPTSDIGIISPPLLSSSSTIWNAGANCILIRDHLSAYSLLLMDDLDGMLRVPAVQSSEYCEGSIREMLLKLIQLRLDKGLTTICTLSGEPGLIPEFERYAGLLVPIQIGRPDIPEIISVMEGYNSIEEEPHLDQEIIEYLAVFSDCHVRVAVNLLIALQAMSIVEDREISLNDAQTLISQMKE